MAPPDSPSARLSSDELVVGLDLGFLSGPRTGIANYAVNMIRAAAELDQSLAYRGFRHVRWTDALPASLRVVAGDRAAPTVPREEAAASAIKALAGVVSHMRPARLRYRSVR